MQLRAVVTVAVAGAVVVAAVVVAEIETEEWVVEGGQYARTTDGERWSVVCVPAGDLALPYSERGPHREVLTDRETSYTVEEGDPCPPGQIIGEF